MSYDCELVYTNIDASAQCGEKGLTLLMTHVGLDIFEQIILLCLSRLDILQCKYLRIVQHHFFLFTDLGYCLIV